MRGNVKTYDLSMEQGIAFIRYEYDDGETTEWGMIGEAPPHNDLKLDS